jgi:hypothetical protein
MKPRPAIEGEIIIKIDFEKLAGCTPEQASAIMSGIASILSANSPRQQLALPAPKTKESHEAIQTPIR